VGIQFNLAGRLGKDERSFVLGLANPWMFEQANFGQDRFLLPQVGYDDLHHTRPVNELQRGGTLTAGFVPRFTFLPYLQDTFVRFNWVSIAFAIKAILFARR